MTPAWVVLAVSSDKQVESLANQETMAHDLARVKGWTVERVFGRGRQGVGSGKKGVRAIIIEVIAELRALAPAQRPAWLWIRRVDRTSRGKAFESLAALDAITSLGVRIWDHDAGEISLDTPEGEAIAALKAVLARQENEVRSKKARAVIQLRRAAGLPVGKIPYGLQRAAGGRYVALEPQADAVRAAFRMALEGAGGPKIARHLSAIAAPYPYRTGERPVRWDQRRVYRLLRNAAYVNAPAPTDDDPGRVLIDEVTFQRAQRALAARAHRPRTRKYAWPLGGVLRCWCGRNMVGKATGDRHLKRRYYLCPATWNHDGSVRMVRAEAIESAFLDLLYDLVDDPSLLNRRRPDAPSAALLERAVRAARKRLEDVDHRRSAVWDLHAAGKVRADDVQGRLDELAGEREALVAEVNDLEAQRAEAMAASHRLADAALELRQARETWRDATGDERREIAYAVAGYLGGLCVEQDGELSVRWPEDPAAQARRRALARRAASQGERGLFRTH